MLDRIGVTKLSKPFGDGSSKRIGKSEIIRRLVGASKVAELSIDDAKAGHLLRPEGIRGPSGSRLLQQLQALARQLLDECSAPERHE